MKIIVLGSSSSGNSTFVNIDNVKFLIDAGLQFGKLKDALYSINERPEDLDFIIVTHAHSDHVKSVHSFNRVYNTKIYISIETLNEYNKKDYIKNYELFDELDNIMGIKFTKIPISHDKKGFGFVFEKDGKSLAYMTDTGMIHSRYHEKMKNKNAPVRFDRCITQMCFLMIGIELIASSTMAFSCSFVSPELSSSLRTLCSKGESVFPAK